MYPNILVEGQSYPIAGWKKLISNLISVLQIAFLIIIFGGEYVKPYITFIPPNILELIEQKKWAFAIGTYLGGSMISNFLQTSGAFEVFANEKLVIFYLIRYGQR
jgi:hypothetical protein